MSISLSSLRLPVSKSAFKDSRPLAYFTLQLSKFTRSSVSGDERKPRFFWRPFIAKQGLHADSARLLHIVRRVSHFWNFIARAIHYLTPHDPTSTNEVNGISQFALLHLSSLPAASQYAHSSHSFQVQIAPHISAAPCTVSLPAASLYETQPPQTE